jgi:serine/threonine-protein kinase
VSSSIPPPSATGDTEPGPPLSLPGVALWGDSDPPAGGASPSGFAGLVSQPSAPLPTIGHIGRYALKYQLGEGGLGTVFAAHDPLLSRLIAVKTLNVEVPEAERESFNALFINEARAAGGLSHPHIVTVFDAGISDKRAYIAMEMLKGRDLRQLRQEGWRATPAQAALITRRVADALAFAHSKGVIHRDIKPANIFMVGRTQPRVLDFGIARIAHQQDGNDEHSGAGSPYYMAPEQVRREPTDRRADVFSLGVVLYELLTDVRPFRGESLKQIRDAVLTHEPPLASKVDPGVPKALAQIAARAMAKDPDQRFRSARSFARELRAWLDTHPVNADGESIALPAPSQPRRRSAMWTGAVITGLALACATTTFFWWQAPSEADSDAASALTGAPAGAALQGAPSGSALAGATPAAEPLTPSPPTDPSPAPGPAPSTVASTEPTPAAAVVVAPSVTLGEAAGPAASRAEALQTQEAILSVSLGLLTPKPLPAPGAAAPSGTAAPAPGPAAAPSAAPAPLHGGAPSIGTGPLKPAAAPATGTTAVAAPTAPTLAAAPRESAREARARESRQRELRAVDARLANAPLAAPPTGTIRIAISPWGNVEVDGAPAGAAPPLTELTLAEGRHQIVVRNGDFAPFVASVNVTAGQTTSLRHKFGL